MKFIVMAALFATIEGLKIQQKWVKEDE